MTIQNVFVGARDGLSIAIFDSVGRMTRNARMASGRQSMASLVPSVKEMRIGQMCGLSFAQIVAAKKRRGGFLEPQDDSKTALKVRFPAPADAPDDADDPDAEPIDLAAKPKMRVRFPKTIVERRADGRIVRRKADL